MSVRHLSPAFLPNPSSTSTSSCSGTIYSRLSELQPAIRALEQTGMGTGITQYLAGKSMILQEILALSNLATDEKQTIFELNTRTGPPPSPLLSQSITVCTSSDSDLFRRALRR